MNLSKCNKCKDLVINRTQVVLPLIRGSNPRVLFLGEAPGATEDIKGEPFCGSAGKYHWWFAKELGVSDSCVIGNCINCRPVIITKDNKKINGKPTETQLKNCEKWRNKLLNSFSFKLIILYGSVPIQTILHLDPPVYKLVNKSYHVPGIDGTFFACYHPATLIYNNPYYKPLWDNLLETAKTLM